MIYPPNRFPDPYPDAHDWPDPYPEPGYLDQGVQALHGLAGGADWQQVQDEVNREMDGRIAVIGAPGAGKRTLIQKLRGRQSVSPGASDFRSWIHDGFFLIIDRPSSADHESQAILLDDLQTVDLILYLIDGEQGVQTEDITWISAVRSRGMKLLGALSKADRLDHPRASARDMSASLGLPLIPIAALDGQEEGLRELVEHILKVSPNLSIPLAREAPLARTAVTERIIRQSALTAAILGASPAPLLDLPLQVTNHMRMALRIGAAHGQPGADYLSREMMAAVSASLGLRYLIQQVIRLVPVLGWVINAAIQAASTYLLGRSLARYYASNWDAMSNQELLHAANPLPKIVSIGPFRTFHRLPMPPIPSLSRPSLSRWRVRLSFSRRNPLKRRRSHAETRSQ